MINRLTLGATPAAVDHLRAQNIEQWIEQQLDPGEEPAALAQHLSELPSFGLDPADAFDHYGPKSGMRQDPSARMAYRKGLHGLYLDAASARVLRGVYSPWQLRELLTDFWFNHFNVFFHKGLCALWTGDYEQTALRPHLFGRFEDLLLATARHPAMLFYLDNWRNAVPSSRGGRAHSGFNENYGREVMELHTIGLHYSQADVIGATRLLTGWGLNRRRTFHFASRRHDFSPQTILDKRFAGGEDAIIDFLRFLARHPDTARHISFEMAQYFVADVPPQDMVEHMTARYSETEGDLKAVTIAMIEHPAFARSAAQRNKFRTPYRYTLALLRATGCELDTVKPLIGALHRLGQPLYGCVPPNGWANTQTEWLSPDALTQRLNLAVAIGGGWMKLFADHPHGHALPLVTVLEALQHAAPHSVLAAARSAPPAMQTAVLLGSPQMQYC